MQNGSLDQFFVTALHANIQWTRFVCRTKLHWLFFSRLPPGSRPAFFALALSPILVLITLRCVFRDSLTLRISLIRHNFADAPF